MWIPIVGGRTFWLPNMCGPLKGDDSGQLVAKLLRRIVAHSQLPRQFAIVGPLLPHDYGPLPSG